MKAEKKKKKKSGFLVLESAYSFLWQHRIKHRLKLIGSDMAIDQVDDDVDDDDDDGAGVRLANETIPMW